MYHYNEICPTEIQYYLQADKRRRQRCRSLNHKGEIKLCLYVFMLYGIPTFYS